MIPTLVFVLFAWRFACLVWMPLNVQNLPGAFFEASAMTSTALIAVWLVFGDGSGARRVWRAGLLFALARMGTFAGLFFGGWIRAMTISLNDVNIFQMVEDELLVTSLVLAAFVRCVTRARLSICNQVACVAWPGTQISLRLLFLFTAVVGLLLSARQVMPQLFGDGFGGAIHLFIYTHAVAISCVTVPSLLVMLGRPSRWGVAGLACYVATLPFMIAIYFYRDDFWKADVLRHQGTSVGGALATVLITAGVCRAAGIRLRLVDHPRQKVPLTYAYDPLARPLAN